MSESDPTPEPTPEVEPKKYRKVHALDDDNNPSGPLLCGKETGLVLGPEGLKKGDMFCRKCALALMARNNEYADVLHEAAEAMADDAATIRQLRLKVIRKDRTIVKLVERSLEDVE